MSNEEDTGSPGWSASIFMQTTEDMARAVASEAAAATAAHSARPTVVFSSKDDHGGSKLLKLQQQFSRVIMGFSSNPPEVKRVSYNPEVLTTQKRQWANFQLHYLDHRPLKEPSRLFESMVVLGIHPHCDLQVLQRQYAPRKLEGSNHSRVEPILEPQVLFVYPPEKQLPIKHKDLVSFCFPGGLAVKAVERTPSMSELNEILLGQEHLKHSDLSFVFRLQVADDSTLYGCCMLVEEIVQKPSGLLSAISSRQSGSSPLSRHILSTRRCYCILSRLPFFELHFGVLNSIFLEERLKRLTHDITAVDLDAQGDHYSGTENLDAPVDYSLMEDHTMDEADYNAESSTRDSMPKFSADDGTYIEEKISEGHIHSAENHLENSDISIDSQEDNPSTKEHSAGTKHEGYDDENLAPKKIAGERHVPTAVLPLLRYYQYESSESSSSFHGSPSEDGNFRSDVDDTETEDASFSGQDDLDGDHSDILEWAKANNHGSLQIIGEYYRLKCPARGSTLRFHPLEHLHPLEYHRPDETVLSVAGSTIDLRSFSTSLELAEAHNALLAEEEATSLSTWALSCICGSLRLEHVLTMFAGALLEKQIVVVCSNLGLLSASVLSVVPLIRPYRWQGLLMPILPDDMLDFLDAPVPYIVGVKNKTSEVQSKLNGVILVDANRNQVKSPTIPQLPKYRELFTSLSPYHAQLVGESFLARKRPVYECTEAQVEAAKGFLAVIRSYLHSLCSNLRSHTITNVQSNNDKVSLLLKESFIDSFHSRDRPFMKLFVDTQMFSVHTDLLLSVIQKQ